MHMHHHDAGEQLGKVSFPISCAPASQKAFDRGVALMHSFEYEEAEAQFIRDRQERSVVCHGALGHRAQLRSTRSGSGRSEPTLKQGHEQMVMAQKLGAKTEREQDYIAALAHFLRQPHLGRLHEARDRLLRRDGQAVCEVS